MRGVLLRPSFGNSFPVSRRVLFCCESACTIVLVKPRKRKKRLQCTLQSRCWSDLKVCSDGSHYNRTKF